MPPVVTTPSYKLRHGVGRCYYNRPGVAYYGTRPPSGSLMSPTRYANRHATPMERGEFTPNSVWERCIGDHL